LQRLMCLERPKKKKWVQSLRPRARRKSCPFSAALSPKPSYRRAMQNASRKESLVVTEMVWRQTPGRILCVSRPSTLLACALARPYRKLDRCGCRWRVGPRHHPNETQATEAQSIGLQGLVWSTLRRRHRVSPVLSAMPLQWRCFQVHSRRPQQRQGDHVFRVLHHLFNLAFRYTTAAQGSLALSTLPLTTMLVGAAFGVEALDRRKIVGVIIAMAGAAVAFVTGLADAPTGLARRPDHDRCHADDGAL